MQFKTAVLIHGAGATQLSWASISRYLKDAEPWIDRQYANYSIHTSFKDIMKRVIPVVNAAGPDVCVIGHSFGGIVGWHASQSCPNVQGGISISTPWGGSAMAQIAALAAGFWGNMFFENVGRYETHIKAPREIELQVPWLNVVTTRGIFSAQRNDGVVTESSQRQLRQSTMTNINTIELDHSHTEVLHSPELMAAISTFLG